MLSPLMACPRPAACLGWLALAAALCLPATRLMAEAGSPAPAPKTAPKSVPGAAAATAKSAPKGMDPQTLGGLVADDAQAVFKGKWEATHNVTPFVGEGYRYSFDPKATATFKLKTTEAGNYALRVIWQAHPTRSDKVPVSVSSTSGTQSFLLNQKLAPKAKNGFEPIGNLHFISDDEVTVTISVPENALTDRVMITVDAVQLVRLP